MNIRNATYHDAAAIKLLLEGLGYTTRTSILVGQFESMFGKDDNQVFVYEMQKDVVGFISVHFISQLAFEGDLVFISYLAFDEGIKDPGIAKALEQHIVESARRRKCDRIQVHCSEWRMPAHQFYIQQGYLKYLKYFTKRLVCGE
jgi:ribosomal protein S18 acetylase RimI-like enzyme